MTADLASGTRSRRLLLGAATGVVAAAAGLATSELVSGYLHQRVSPVIAVSESIIRITPGWLIEHVISVLGHHDKPVLIALTLLGLTLVSAAVGVLSLRSVLAAQGAFLLMGVVLVMAVHARLTSSTVLYVAPILGVVAAIGVLAVLAADRDPGPAPQSRGPGALGGPAQRGRPCRRPGAADSADDDSSPVGRQHRRGRRGRGIHRTRDGAEPRGGRGCAQAAAVADRATRRRPRVPISASTASRPG